MSAIELAIVWRAAQGSGRIEILNGQLNSAALRHNGQSKFLTGSEFELSPSARLHLHIDACEPAEPGTIVRIIGLDHPFTFFARDASTQYPILIPDYGVAVTGPDDHRTYDQILGDVRALGLQTKLGQIATEPEESLAAAAAATRALRCPTWLGISRDVRIFEFNLRGPMQVTDYIQPRFHGYGYFWPEPDKNLLPSRYGFVAGRGWGCTEDVHRRIDEGTLPILHVQRIDDEIRYDTVMFATLERTALTESAVRGTHPLVADGMCPCHAFTESQQKLFDSLRDAELSQDEEVVLCCRTVATNMGTVPRHAFFKALHPVFGMYGSPAEHLFDAATGAGFYADTNLAYGISQIDGKPLPREELALLIAPGETCTYDFYLPHRPISRGRAAALARRDIATLLSECRAFWNGKLDRAAKIELPEKRIENHLRSGIAHFDLTSYGHDPDGALNGTNGVYSALGSETTTNIVFLDSLGLHDLAQRHLAYFFEKQRENGLIQNFDGYMLETGAILWCAGEHFRHTHSNAFVEKFKSRILLAADFLVNWRNESKREELRGKGYGLCPGRVADPLDEQRIFMLNGYSYLGLSRAAEMLAGIDAKRSTQLAAEAESYRRDIREAFFAELASGPAIPAADGTWCPTAGPWIGAAGPAGLRLEGQSRWSHGAFMLPDDVLGPMHLVFQEVIDPSEPAAELLLRFYSELYFSRNFPFSQPYYSRHPWVHLRRRETAAFLKAWYTGVASLADRETGSWWEHYFHVSNHKTHEEGNFLMQARWMLWLEEGDQLSLLRGVPRAWLEDGKRIALHNVASYFGPLSLEVVSNLNRGTIDAKIICNSDRKPRRVELRLPHPRRDASAKSEGGVYQPETESVLVDNFNGRAQVRVHFAG